MECNLNALSVLLHAAQGGTLSTVSQTSVPYVSSQSTQSTGSEPHECFLDAFAAIAMSTEDESISTALRTNESKKQALLFIAAQKSVSVDTVRHLRRIWDELGQISLRPDLSFSINAIFSFPLNGHGLRLMCLVYQFSYEVIRRRFERWWPILSRASRIAANRPFKDKILAKAFLPGSPRYCSDDDFAAAQVPNMKSHEAKLQFLLHHLRLCYRFLESIPVGCTVVTTILKNSVKFALSMNMSAGMAQTLLAIPGICEQWGRDLNSTAPLPLRQAIRNLTEFHLNLYSLVRFAYSELGRSILPLSPIFIVVPTIRTPDFFQSHWPNSVSDWNHFRDSIYAFQFALPRCSNDLLKNTLDTLPQTACQNTVLHPECAMIDYLESNLLRSSETAFYYIGLSHSPCAACFFWTLAYNQYYEQNGGGHIYRTRLSNFKWEKDWCMPPHLAPQLLAGLLLRFSAMFVALQTFKKQARVKPRIINTKMAAERDLELNERVAELIII